jgi:hypothetical protein
MHAKCVQPVCTVTHEKTKCQGLNQTKTKMQRWGERRVCDGKQMNKWPNNQP